MRNTSGFLSGAPAPCKHRQVYPLRCFFPLARTAPLSSLVWPGMLPSKKVTCCLEEVVDQCPELPVPMPICGAALAFFICQLARRLDLEVLDPLQVGTGECDLLLQGSHFLRELVNLAAQEGIVVSQHV